jgi:hypothetical protein
MDRNNDLKPLLTSKIRASSQLIDLAPIMAHGNGNGDDQIPERERELDQE